MEIGFNIYYHFSQFEKSFKFLSTNINYINSDNFPQTIGRHDLDGATCWLQHQCATHGRSGPADVHGGKVRAVKTPRQLGRVQASSGLVGALLAQAGDDGRPRQLEIQRHGAPLLQLLHREDPCRWGARQELPLRLRS